MRDDILSSGYEQKVTRRPTATGSYIERTEVTQTPQGAMKAWLERGIEAVGRGIAYTDVITLTPDAASGLDTVQAEFTMTPAYDITVTLSLADSSQGNCLMTLPLSGQPQLVVIGTGHAQSRVVIDILYVELYLALHHCRTAGNHLACHVVERESVAVTLLIVPIDSQRHM